MGVVLTTGVQGTITVIITLSPEVLYRTSLNVSSHRTRKMGPDGQCVSEQETGQKQNEQERQGEGIQNIPQYVMEEPAREEIEWLE